MQKTVSLIQNFFQEFSGGFPHMHGHILQLKLDTLEL